MRKFPRIRHFVPIALLLLLLLLPGVSLAQEGDVVVEDVVVEDVVVEDVQPTRTAMAPTVTSSRDRLYLNFVEDAMITDEQWWEGWVQYDDRDQIDRTILFGQAAFQVWRNTEIGGRVGFGKTDTNPPLDDGTGATDFDFWGKYYWNLGNDRTEITAGAILTVPTGDDSVGLGFDAFALKGFGAVRWRLSTVVITGTLGLQLNDDGRTLNSPSLDGQTAFSAGAGVIAPWSDSFSFIGELTWSGKRFKGLDDEAALLGGLNLRLSERSLLRPSIAVGLQDGAPDWQVYIGYAYAL
jgi:hypothetical protein